MQNSSHTGGDDKFSMSFANFDPDTLFPTHMGTTMGAMGIGMKRSAHDAGLDRDHMGLSSDDDVDLLKKDDKLHSCSSRDALLHQQTSLEPPQSSNKQNILPNGKKTKGRVKIKMEFIDNKLRRYTTFSKRKTGIMKKAYELSTLTGTQVMLLVASETGHVYTFATRKLQPMITSEAGKALIQTCLNSPDPPPSNHYHHDQRMSATGYEETELTYAVSEDEHKNADISEEYLGGGSSSPSDSSTPPTPVSTPTPISASQPTPSVSSQTAGPSAVTAGLPVQLPSGIVLASSVPGGGVVVSGTGGGGVVYAAGGGVLYAAPQTTLASSTPAPLLFNLPASLQVKPERGSLLGGISSLSPPVSLATSISGEASSLQSHQSLPTDLSLHIKRESQS